MSTVNSSRNVTTTKNKLTVFLTKNPHSDIESIDKIHIISKPWNDDSLILLLLPKVKRKLIDTLNNLILPPRFTAIYHIDTNTMEYIYTRLKPDDPILSRQFVFTLDNKHYSCKFWCY